MLSSLKLLRNHQNLLRFVQCSQSLSASADQGATHSTGTSVDSECVTHHEKFSQEWWDESGFMKPLHSMNTLRVPFIRDGLLHVGTASKSNQGTSKPLNGVRIVDVGCGGGLLCEPLARIGAFVTGIDPSAKLIEIAKSHASLDQNLENLSYVNVTAEILAQDMPGQFDAVVSSEVIEHVSDKNVFLEQCIKLLKPQGSIFLSTLNRTSESWLLAIVAAEQIFRIIPQGTHSWDQFVTPQELQIMLERHGCSTRLIHGMWYNPLTNGWQWSANTSVSYALHAVKQT